MLAMLLALLLAIPSETSLVHATEDASLPQDTDTLTEESQSETDEEISTPTDGTSATSNPESETTAEPESTAEPEATETPVTEENVENSEDDSAGFSVSEATATPETTAATEITAQETVSQETQETEETQESEENTPETNSLSTEETSSTKLVYSWSWVDEDEILTYYEDEWILDIPGASEELQVDQETLLSFLPTQLQAQTIDGIETVDITWDLSEYPESAYEGTYTIQAVLPELYILDSEAPTLDVTVNLGGIELYSTTSDVVSKHLVQGVTPRGVTMNLFNYWITDDTEEDEDNPDQFDSSNYTVLGINNNGTTSGHTLKFTSLGISGTLNGWTGSTAPNTGIVASTLGDDGYPHLSNTPKTNNDNESLKYLFDDSDVSSGTPGKNAYMGVTNLLRIDSDGYYYYKAGQGTSSSSDSWQSRDGNFASFDKTTNSFKLYDKYGVYYTTALADHTIGSFFPFNTAEQVFSGEDSNGELKLDTSIYPTSPIMNHFFGLTMTTKFIQQNSGLTTNTSQPITYEFTGDDDIWVFIDGVLVADLGGIHDAASLKIDFNSGAIYINGTQNGTLLSKYREAEKEGSVSWNENTFADNTYHTLNFYYLERGAGGSNMALKFNLVTVPETEVDKIDQMGNAVPGATFNVYACDESGEKKSEILATGATDSDGVFVLQDTSGKILRLNELKETSNYDYLLLEESSVPAGYRKSEDLILRIVKADNNNVLNDSSYILKCTNPSTSGGYATSRVLITAPNNVYYADSPSGTAISYTTTGKLFPVIMKYKGTEQTATALAESKNWVPVTGNQVDGWNVKSDSSMSNIIAAAKENGLEFDLTSSGSYQVQINDLPGDIDNYYLFLNNSSSSKVEYAVVLYYTTANSLDEATTENTKRVYDPVATSSDQSNCFTRQLSSKIYVPNISNNFYVQKMDEDNNVLDATTYGSAIFTLYSDEACTTVVQTRSTSDTNDLKLKGIATFTKLSNGTYYLKETKAPNGFDISEQVVEVIVNNGGVFVNAGSADDGVKVELGPGVVLKSLQTFADGTLDYTLKDIIATMSTATDVTTDSTTNNDTTSWTETETKMHLSYAASNKILEYGLEKQTGDADWPSGFTVDTGYAKLSYTQWYDDSHNTEKVQITGDISNLFAQSMIVQIQDTTAPHSLKIIKTDQNGNPVTDAAFTLYEYDYSNSTKKDTVLLATGTTDENGVVNLKDTNGEELNIRSLANYEYLYLQETSVPDGYRSTGDAILKVHVINDTNGKVEEVYTTCENTLSTGVVPTNRVTITATNQVYSDEDCTTSINYKSSGLLIPVVMKKNDSGNWVAVYGSSFDGWTEASSAVTAIKRSKIFFESTDAGWTVDIEDLPGELENYLYINSDNSSYRIDYYYSTASSINNVNSSNTSRVYTKESGKFIEAYGSSVHVPNISNTLIVQKVDEDGNPITTASATFNLYQSNRITIENSTVTVSGNPYQSKQTDVTNKAYAYFTNLSSGTYYLNEYSAPAGYKASSAWVKVTVGEDGNIEVGKPEDSGIKVETKSDELVSTMKAYQGASGINQNLYVKNTYVIVPNAENVDLPTITNGLTIGKQVVNGDSNAKSKDFTFTVHLETMQYTGTGTYGRQRTSWYGTRTEWVDCYFYNYLAYSGTITSDTTQDNYFSTNSTSIGDSITFDSSGNAEITLKHGEYITFELNPVTIPGYKTVGNGVYYTTYYYSIVYENGTTPVDLYTEVGSGSKSYGWSYTVKEEADDDFTTTYQINDGDSYEYNSTYGTLAAGGEGTTVRFINTMDTKSFSFYKVGKNSDGETIPLSGATFAVYQQLCEDDHSNDLLYINDYSTGQVSEDYQSCWGVEPVEIQTSDETGLVTFTKLLADKTYRLVELKPPEGYPLPSGQWILTDIDTNGNSLPAYTVAENGGVNNPPAYDSVNKYIYNYLLQDLPHSGDIGTHHFYRIGAIVMIVGMLWMIKNLHNDNEGKESTKDPPHKHRKRKKKYRWKWTIPIWKRRKRL